MRIRQSHFVPPVPYVVAEELGLFAAADVEVETQRARSSGDQLALLRSSDIDVAITAMDNVFAWNLTGAQFAIAAQIESTTRLTVYARPGHRSLSDIHGCSFAVDALGNGFSVLARAMLEDAGVEASLVECGGVTERLAALVAGEFDATLLGPPLDAAAERAGLVPIASVNEVYPALPGQGVVVPARPTEAQRATLAAYLGAMRRAVELTAAWSDAEGVALLERSGLSADGAEVLWRTRPRTLDVSEPGVRLLTDLRRAVGTLPPDAMELPRYTSEH